MEEEDSKMSGTDEQTESVDHHEVNSIEESTEIIEESTDIVDDNTEIIEESSVTNIEESTEEHTETLEENTTEIHHHHSGGEEEEENTEENGEEEQQIDEETNVERGKEAEQVIDEEIEIETDLVWNENRCVVCNVGMDVNDPANRTEANTKLKKFFFEYLAVSEKLDVLPNDPSFPFCTECAEDLDKLMTLACKIEFMDLQFEKLRDTMARKTVKTFLHRTRPEMMSESPEPLYDDVKDEPVETTNLPKRLYNLSDLLFRQWKRQYDVIIPGRYKKYPSFMKAVDSKQRISYYRVDPSGKHHFISSINSDGSEAVSTIPSESPARTQVILQGVQGLQQGVHGLGLHQGVLRGLKRKPVYKINGDTLKRVRTCQDENSLEGSYNGDEVEVEGQREVIPTSSAVGEKMYKCPLCPKTFTSKSVLNYHSRTHSGELPFVCDVCGKGFAVPHYLMIHMRSHTGERPFKCNVCEKTFAQRGGLATHALVHSGEKPYVCNECGKAFRQKYHLTQHQLIHSGVKPFQCEICEKRFNVKMNLREHMRRHTGERPYRCNFCACQGFFRKKMLRDHIVKAHPERQMPPELVQLGPTQKFPKAKITNNSTMGGPPERTYSTMNKNMISGDVNIKAENQMVDHHDEEEEEEEEIVDDNSFNMASSATLISIDVMEGEDVNNIQTVPIEYTMN